MRNKIEEINTEQTSIMFNGSYHFLNSDDFNMLCKKILPNNKIDVNNNIIKIGVDVYIKFNGDLSDLGNDIGINVAEYIDDDKLGYEKDDLISGLNHGISIIDGTHG